MRWLGGKKADRGAGDAGAGGEQEPSGGGASAGSNTSGKSQGGSGGATDGGAPTAGSPSEGGSAGEGAVSGLGGAGGEGAVSGQGGAPSSLGGAGGEVGANGGCCDPQVNYSATGSVLPSDDACAPWTMVDTADPEVPSFNGDALRVASSADAENMFFHQSGGVLSFPDVFVFEARMKLVSGTGSTPSRGPAGMAFAYGPQRMKNMVQMSATEVFILSGENTKGTSITFDTTSAFHTYRIVADTQANTFELFIDDELEISGTTFAANSAETVQFGETSLFGYGISAWEFVRHNAYRCAEEDL